MKRSTVSDSAWSIGTARRNNQADRLLVFGDDARQRSAGQSYRDIWGTSSASTLSDHPREPADVD